MKFLFICAVLAVITIQVLGYPKYPEISDKDGSLETVRYKRLSCLFENQAVSAIACGTSCIVRKGKRGGYCSNGICRCV